MIETYYSHGKLLLSGEYAVLKGAKALALPLNVGQGMHISATDGNTIQWETQEKGLRVFSAIFAIKDLSLLTSSDASKANYILTLLKAAQKLSPSFLKDEDGFEVLSSLEFDMQWGLGSSSTLINNIALWAKVNPYEINALVSQGSGYDIACASAKSALTFQLSKGKPSLKSVVFAPPFINHLSLVYLNKKMATEKNIQSFLHTKNANFSNMNKQIDQLTQNFLDCNTINDFMHLLKDHENVISDLIGQQPVKQKLFSDFNGEIKSLGAWGGDFVLAASQQNFEKQQKYFNNKGYTTVIPLKKLMLA